LKVLLDKKSIVRSQSASLPRNSAALLSLQEGFQLFESDLSKLQVLIHPEICFHTYGKQQFIELNATGFAKALKKWDKRSKSQTKELYLSRQVEGVFDFFSICLHPQSATGFQ
jgi:CDK inhibitor PHO81